jgi:hypothetical protein
MTVLQGPLLISALEGHSRRLRSRFPQLFYTVHCYYMGDELGQEQCLERSLQASLVNVVRPLPRRECTSYGGRGYCGPSLFSASLGGALLMLGAHCYKIL